MERIEFNLERALAGDKLITRDGNDVHNFHERVDVNDFLDYPYGWSTPVGDKRTCLANGAWHTSGYKHANDLFMAEEKEVKWAPEKGEMVEVSDNHVYWHPAEFVTEYKGTFHCWNTNESISSLTPWLYCRKIPVVKMTIIVDGKEIDPMKLSNEQIKIINKNYFNG